MTTYRVNYGDHKNIEYPEYTKFPRKLAPCGITWVALEVAPNRVKRFDLSQLSEVVDPRLTGMVYGCEEPPPEPLTVIMPVSAAKAINHTNVRVLKFADVSLYHDTMKAAA